MGNTKRTRAGQPQIYPFGPRANTPIHEQLPDPGRRERLNPESPAGVGALAQKYSTPVRRSDRGYREREEMSLCGRCSAGPLWERARTPLAEVSSSHELRLSGRIAIPVPIGVSIPCPPGQSSREGNSPGRESRIRKERPKMDTMAHNEPPSPRLFPADPPHDHVQHLKPHQPPAPG
jgi:hypothetical protein